MKKVILRVAVLLAIFVVGVVGFSGVMNQQDLEMTREATSATLPTLSIDYNGYKINQMYGYTKEMNQSTMRDGLIPLTTNREISVSMQDYGNKIDSVTYEVTSLIDGTVIENAKVGSFKADGEYQTADFALQQPILMNQEYGLKFTLRMLDQEVYYYTRVVQRASLNTEEYLDFAYDFYERCLDKESASALNLYLETDDYVANNSYTGINIHSTIDQVSWGDLNPHIYQKPIATVKEINETTGSVQLKYMITAQDENGDTEFYYVTDFFRMRYYQSRIMLLDFERNAQQIYTANKASVTTKGLDLGVANKAVPFVTNESNTIVAFAQAGELWSYNSSADRLAQVFTMRGGEDGRDNYSERNVKIVRVEESGDISFIVYGYMGSDVHEGQVGISVRYFSSDRNVVEEQMFIPLDISYEYLQDELDKLLYINRADSVYIYLNRCVYRVDLAEKTYEIVLSQINPDCFLVSKDQSYIAWMDEMQLYGSKTITVMDLESGSTRKIAAEDGCRIQALGFMNSDFIYGLAAESDIVTDVAGNTTFAMRQIVIEDKKGNQVKNYSADGMWVYEIEVQDGLIELRRVTKNETGYVLAATDNIMNNQNEEENTVVSRVSSSSRRGTIVTLVMPNVITNKEPLINTCKLVDHEVEQQMELSVDPTRDAAVYYVYAKGTLQGSFSSPAAAILAADEQVGVVVNDRQQYIWERGNSQVENDLNNEDIPAIFLSGTMDEQLLQEGLGEAGEVMNLTGCTLEEVLYQLSKDRAVIARNPDGSTAVIVGYDRYNTLLYNFETGEHYYYGINDSTNLFLEGGNVFISYVEKPVNVTK